MRASVWNILIIMLLVGITGCKKKDDDVTPVAPDASGAILVNVFYNGQPVPDAVVSTNPESGEATTETSGSVLIEDVSDGIYHVFATHDLIGSGSAAVVVEPGDVSNATIHLIYGVFQGPMVDFISGNPVVPVGDTLSVGAMVYDIIDEHEDLVFEWSTDLDGVISTQGIGENGYALLEYVFETTGNRTLTLTVTNSAGESNSAQRPVSVIEPPEPVVLEPIEMHDLALQLSWSQAEVSQSQFMCYRIYRQDQSGFTLIQSIFNINTTSFSDTDINIESEYSYKVSIYSNYGYETMSNIQTWQYDGEYIDIGTGLDMMLHDPDNPLIYGLDTDNNSLVIINTDIGQVVNSFYVGSTPVDMDFSLDNQLLYIANYGSTEITVVDLVSQSVQSSFFVETDIGTWGGNPYTLAVLADGLLAFSGNDSFNDIKLVDISTGNNVFTTSTTFRDPYLLANSDGTKLFVGESGSSWSHLHRLNVSNNQLTLVEDSEQFSNPERKVFITDNDAFLIYAESKFLASNLPSLLGSFNNEIYAINSDASRVLGENFIYDGNNYSVVSQLPVSTKVSVFSNDGSSAYLYHESSTRLYKISVE